MSIIGRIDRKLLGTTFIDLQDPIRKPSVWTEILKMLLGWNKLEHAEFRKQVGRELHFWYGTSCTLAMIRTTRLEEMNLRRSFKKLQPIHIKQRKHQPMTLQKHPTNQRPWRGN